MALSPRRWIIGEPAPAEFIATLPAYSPLVATLLYQRGLRSPEEVAAFFGDSYPTGTHLPFAMQGMEQAATRIAAAIRRGEPMAVYGDFDTDGVTAVALLMRAIPAFGGSLYPYIPHRAREGYGLNIEAVEQLYARGIRLLITVDCGISNVAEVARAQELGLDVIVTDHHTPPAILPAAFCVVNPKQPGCEYPFKHLVGVGIAFKLVQALWKLGLRANLTGRDLLDVVAIGTVTDMGSLKGENRVLVKAGLEALNMTSRPGLRALIKESGIQGLVDATTISFTLGPRINAAGRLDDARLAYELLLADDAASAEHLAQKLNEANRERQDLTRQVQEDAREQAVNTGKQHQRLVLLAHEDYKAGVVGLVAGRLAEEWGRPVLVLEQGDTTSRGSARSIPGFNIVAALERCSDLLVRYGGHAQAAGFTIENALVPELEQRLLAIANDQLTDADLGMALYVDAELPLQELNTTLLDQLNRFEPFGQDNPRPTLISRNVRIEGVWNRGAEGRTLKLRVSNGRGFAIDAIGFRMGHLAPALLRLGRADVAYQLDLNEWNGVQRLQLRLRDIAPCEGG